MKKTILITGTSSGIGKAAVRLFSAKGWNVAATMRRPEQEIELGQLPNVRLYKLDVMDENSIQTALQDILKDFGGLDAIVNNAGYGAVGIFEAATPEQIRKQFDTNVFGVMNVIRAVLPHFRAKRNGTIINITSMGGLITFPIYSVYHGTKWAVEGFSEALQFELRYFNIRVKCVEPGAIKTDFYDRSMDLFKKEDLTDYDAYQEVAYRNSQQAGYNAPGPEMVARKIYQAANDSSFRLRYPVGKEAPSLLVLRRLIPLSWFTFMVRMVVEKGFRNLQPA
jgi:NAD(P)-dependent dehydrogenase (short-subunit alcohol dehydrogenase family)